MSFEHFISLLSVLACLFNCVASQVENEVVNLNDVVEPVISELRKTLIEQKQDKVRVSDMSESYKIDIFGRKFSVLQFTCSNGWVGDVSSISRAGDFIMYPEGNAMALELPFRFNDLQYNCDSYLLRVPILKFDGRLNAKVGYNKLNLKILIEFVNDKCTYRIERFQVQNFSDIKVRITGFSVFNGLLNKVVTSCADKFKTAISGKFLNELQDALVNKVEEFRLCTRNQTANYVNF